MPNDKPETQSRIATLEIDFSAIEKRIMARIQAGFFSAGEIRSEESGTITARNVKPPEFQKVLSESKLREMIEAAQGQVYIRKIRIAPGTLDLFAKVIEQTEGITFTQKDQAEGTVNFSAFDGLEVVEDPMFFKHIGAMDMSDGTVRLFDWTPEEAK